MAGKLKEAVLNDVRALIHNLTGFEEEDDNFRACERFILSNIIHHQFVSVNSHDVRRSIDGITQKFYINGTFEKAREFDSLVKTFLANEDYKNHETIDVQWALLSFLLGVAQNPTGAGKKEPQSDAPIIVPAVHDDNASIDWAAYLREGEEEFERNWNEDSDCDNEDEVDCCAAPSTITHFLPRATTPCHTPSYTPPTSPFTQHHETLSLLRQTDNKQLRAQGVQRGVAAEKWLEDHTQHAWWSNPQYKQEVVSKSPSSCLVRLLEKDKTNNIATFSEHKVVLEVVWLLSVPSASGAFMKAISDDGKEWNIRVRPHVSLPSLTEDAFVDMMSLISSHASMIKELREFCDTVFRGEENRSASHTYQAYCSALQEELFPLQEMISTLECSAHKQEKNHTLFETIEILTPYLQKINMIYSLHQCAVLDWRDNPNWLCATHLLSVLLATLCSEKEDMLALKMFVKAFSAYISIAEQWLTKGQLFDWKNEFLITRCDRHHEQGILGAVVVEREWEKELRKRNVEPPALLQILANCLLKAARPLHVLHHLERLAELHGRISSANSLYHRFLENLVIHLEGLYFPDGNLPQVETARKVETASCSTDSWWNELDCYLQLKPVNMKNDVAKECVSAEKSVSPCLGESDILNYSHRLKDPFLEEAFQDLLCFGLSDTSEGLELPASQEEWEKETYQRLDDACRSLDVGLPLKLVLEKAVYQLSSDWEGVAGSMVAEILVREQRLLHHLHIVQSVFLSQAGHKLQPFFTHLFRMMLLKGDGAWADPHSLSVLLQDCMDADQFSVSLNITDKDPADMSVLEAVDSLHIHYESEWPVSAIIGERCEIAYNKIFHLLAKLRWGVWMLEGLHFADILLQRNHPLVQRLFYLRFWLLHVVRGAYGFVAGHVLNTLWLQFEQDISCAKDLHSIVQVHEKFLETSLQQSLEAEIQEVVKSALFQLLVLAERLKGMWHSGPSKIRDDTLSNMEECFLKCHAFLATVLRTLAGENGYHHLQYLSDIFNHSTPSQRE